MLCFLFLWLFYDAVVENFSNLLNRMLLNESHMHAVLVGCPFVASVAVHFDCAALCVEVWTAAFYRHKHSREVPAGASFGIVLCECDGIDILYGTLFGIRLTDGLTCKNLVTYFPPAEDYLCWPSIYCLILCQRIDKYVELSAFRKAASHRHEAFHLLLNQLFAV